MTKEEEYLNGWKRAKADLINYKKEEAKRFEEIVKFANKMLIQELISVLDSFDLASKSLDEKGMLMIKSQLEDILKRSGLKKIETAVGKQFDPAFHEAVATAESDKPSGTIIEEIEAGYTLHDKIIRPARVKVSK